MNASGTVLSPNRTRQRGSVLIIVMVICMGLVTLTLYFANSMSATRNLSRCVTLQGCN